MSLLQLEQVLETEKQNAAQMKVQHGEGSPFYAAALDAVEEVRSAIAHKRIPVLQPSQEHTWDAEQLTKVYDL